MRIAADRPLIFRIIAVLTAAALTAGAALELPELARVPTELIAACTGWITLALLLELLSIAGFAVAFKLVFGAGLSWRSSTIGALRGVGASALLPGGALVGPAAAASSVGADRLAVRDLARGTVAFTILTNAPEALALCLFGSALWLGWVDGPHDVARTLLPVGAVLGVAAVTLVVARTRRVALRRPSGLGPRGPAWLRQSLAAVGDGAGEALCALRSGDWKLLGPFAVYAFDNAVLWAAFRAQGHSPAASVIVMGYVIGSTVSALPIPGGLVATEGGLVGALVLYGAPAGHAVIAVLLYRAVTLLLPTLVGAAAWGSRLLPFASPQPLVLREDARAVGDDTALPEPSHEAAQIRKRDHLRRRRAVPDRQAV
jgi:uncharacterized membrane protein YbhN (UPF0104 family)